MPERSENYQNNCVAQPRIVNDPGAGGVGFLWMFRCQEGSSAMLLYRKLEEKIAPAVTVAAPILGASSEAVEDFLGGYQKAFEALEPAADENADPSRGDFGLLYS